MTEQQIRQNFSVYARTNDSEAEGAEYTIGARVSHNGKKWFNEVYESNVWEPGVFGWVEE